MKTIYAILLLLPTFFSCTKSGDDFSNAGELGGTFIEGKVFEKGSGKAVSGAEVTLKSQPKGSSMAIFRTDTTVITGEDGRYKISWKADLERNYEVQPKHTLYDNRQSYMAVKPGKKNNLDLMLDPWAWVRVHIINEPPLDTVRSVGVYNFHNKSASYSMYYKDTLYYGKATGNMDWTFMTVILTGTDTFKNKPSIYCPALDTVDYYFKY